MNFLLYPKKKQVLHVVFKVFYIVLLPYKMSTEELQSTIKQYHETLVKERAIKAQLVKKLDSIREVVNSYQGLSTSNSGSKSGGIPFGLSGLNTLASAFMSIDNAGDAPNTSADRIISDIKRILG